MQRRLDLAAALVHRPKIVFLDEPTTGLDPISRDAIWRYVGELNRDEGVTFFLTTQYLEEADRLADDVAIMDAGKIVAQGSPAELKATHRHGRRHRAHRGRRRRARARRARRPQLRRRGATCAPWMTSIIVLRAATARGDRPDSCCC